MVQIKNVLFGKLAVSTRFITEEQLQECLDFQKEIEERGERPPRLGEILEQKGYLTKQQIQSILETMSSMQRRRFGEIAVAFHFITLEQLETCLDIQKLLQAPQETVPLFGQALVTYRGFLKQVLAGGAHPKIGDVLVAMGYMRNHQVEAVLEEQNKRIVRCKSCEASLNISRFEPGQKIKCGQCNAVLEIVKPEGGEDLDVALPTETMSGSGAGVEAENAAGGEDQPVDPATALMELDKEIKQVRATQQFSPAKTKTPGRIADFQVVTRLGQDATGVIFKATQISKNRPVALKIMNPSVMNDPAFQKKFIDDAKKVAALEHPNIKKVYSLGKADNRFYIAMEFVEAESVYNVLEKQGKFHFETAIGIALSISEALQYAQTQGLIHGDVRPSNVLILRDGSVKVANLGLATKVSENILAISRSGQMAPFYIAPECVTGDREMDQRTDIYSLGATLFHMIAGRPPFQGQSPFEVLVRLTEETIPPLKFFDPGIPDSVCRVVEKMLEAEPQDRYQTWEELMVELRAVQAASGTGPVAAPGLPAATAAPGLAAPKPIKTADDAKKEYEARASRSAQMRSVRRGVIVVAVVAALAGGGLWAKNYVDSSNRAEAWSALQSRMKGRPSTKDEFSTRRDTLSRFAAEYPGSGEADEANKMIETFGPLEQSAKDDELKKITDDVNAALKNQQFKAAMDALGHGTFRSAGKDDPELKHFVGEIEKAAQEDWDKLVETALGYAKNDQVQKAHTWVDDAVKRRELAADLVEAPKVHGQIDQIRKDLAAAKLIQEQEEAKKKSRALLDKELKDVWLLMMKWQLTQAQSRLAVLKAQVHPDHVAEVEEWRDRVQWLVDLQTNSIAAVNEVIGDWDRKHDKASDQRPHQLLSNKLFEGRALAASANAIVFQDEKATLNDTVAWSDLDQKTLIDILNLGMVKGGSSNTLHFAFGDAAWQKAEPVTDIIARIRLMSVAEREYKAASDAGLPKPAAPRMEAVAKFFTDTKKEFLSSAKASVQAGKFQDARTTLRSLINFFPTRIDDVAKEISDTFASSYTAGSPGGQYSDFQSGVPADLKPSGGWAATRGVVTGTGKDETLTVEGTVSEVGILFRMPDDKFQLTIELEGAKINFNPNANGGEGTIGIDYLKEKDADGKRPLAFRTKPVKMPQITERWWHTLEVKEAAGAVEVYVDGLSVAMTPKNATLVSPLGALTLRLTGASSGKEGRIELMGLFTRKK